MEVVSDAKVHQQSQFFSRPSLVDACSDSSAVDSLTVGRTSPTCRHAGETLPRIASYSKRVALSSPPLSLPPPSVLSSFCVAYVGMPPRAHEQNARYMSAR